MQDAISTVIVIDDNVDIQDALFETLAREGYRVLLAGNGRDGLELIRNTPTPALVLLDLMMPVMDGWAFARALHDEPFCARFPVVVMSANVDADAAEKLPCVVGVLRKPFEMATLLDIVREHTAPIGKRKR